MACKWEKCKQLKKRKNENTTLDYPPLNISICLVVFEQDLPPL